MKLTVLFIALTVASAVSAQNVLPPVITQQPASGMSVTEGEPVELSVEATGSAPMQYQWYRNNAPIPGEVRATLRFFAAMRDNDAAFTVSVTNPTARVTSGVSAVRVESSRFINISTRGFVGTGGQTMSVGFVIRGSHRGVVVRAVGPTLAAFGVEGVLTNPTLRIVRTTDGASTTVSSNDDWNANDAAVFARVGAFALQAGSRDAALVTGLAAGNYTVEVSGSPSAPAAERTGIALVEVYELP